MILYRSVSLPELELIYDSGMKSFPARLPQQPIFYPVLTLEYARQIASEWNAKSGRSAGYVTEFKVDDAYIGQFEKHTVGGTQHQELWIPAEQLEGFNQHIAGHIKVLEGYFGDEFQGFVPEKFGMQGKNAVEQFNLLTNSYMYTRMDFYLEIKRNHKAVFLNYPFWQKHDFKNPELTKKIVQAIREAWLTSFPQIPLSMPVQDFGVYVEPAALTPSVNPEPESAESIEQADRRSMAEPDEIRSVVQQADQHSFVEPDEQDITPVEQADSLTDFEDKKAKIAGRANSYSLANREGSAPIRQTESHFARGLELGLSGKYQEAKNELSRAVEEDPKHLVSHTSLGVAFHRLGEDDRALSSYEAALRIDPTYAEAHYFRANILYHQGDVREAIAGYTLAIGLEPGLIEAHQKSLPPDRLTDYTGLPAEMYWIAKPARRILDLNRSLAGTPRRVSLFKERAAQYYRLRNYVQAITDYSSYLTVQPDDASVLHLRGIAYEQIGQVDRALDDYQRAITIDPQLSDVYIDRGITLGKMGNYRQSIASLSDGIRLAPGNPDGYFNRGMMYLQQDDFGRAIDDFSKVIELSPEDEEAYYWRGISNEEAGRQREAIADYKQFLAISQNPQTRDQIEQRLNQWKEAERNSVGSRSAVPDNKEKTNQVQSAIPGQKPDLYDLIFALGERALHSTWFGSGVDCYGDSAEELHAFTDHDKPIEGHDLLHITSGIRQTLKGDFQAFDPGGTSPWIFIRAWDGSGFYVETNDPKVKAQLKTHFERVEDVEGVPTPYEGLFLGFD